MQHLELIHGYNLKQLKDEPLNFDPINYHSRQLKGRHIFIYSVLGRSSSTALQRMINSSNEICIWGEPRGTIEMIISTINCLAMTNSKSTTIDSRSAFEYSFRTSKHVSFYANALNDLSNTIKILQASISIMLKPAQEGIERFGYKDIGVSCIEALRYLKAQYEMSSFLFCFRNPMDQWPSVANVGWWDYSKSLEFYLTEYARVSEIYLDFARQYNQPAFIENRDLRNPSKVQKLFKHLNISRWDNDLVDLNVGSSQRTNNIVDHDDEETILRSQAFSNYILMTELSNQFFSNTS